MDNIQKPEHNKSAIEIQTIKKNRDKTALIKVKRSGGANWAMATGRKAKTTKAMPPNHTMPAAKWRNLIHSYIYKSNLNALSESFVQDAPKHCRF
jgi:hypothetical protein